MNTCPSWCSLADFLAGYRPGTLQFMRTSLGRPLEAAVSQISATADTHSSGRNTGPLPVSQRGSHGSNGITHRQDPIPADGTAARWEQQHAQTKLQKRTGLGRAPAAAPTPTARPRLGRKRLSYASSSDAAP
uniref:MTF0991 n=1 Tax=Volvox carteri f. nagariensis TaxID=3068 RepID=D9CIY9_VOLCA|nr:MTF0991 [Volvox carteri f. nagariensis]